MPPGGNTRHVDRTREALFSTIDALIDLDGARVLDLYAGSGAVGLEALSRGAAHALLVEADPRAARDAPRQRPHARPAGRARSGSTGSSGSPRPAPTRRTTWSSPIRRTRSQTDVLATVLQALAEHGWFAPDAVIVVERASRDPEWMWPTPLVPVRSRRYGEGTLWYGRAS